jgi:uncharacterized membrane protein
MTMTIAPAMFLTIGSVTLTVMAVLAGLLVGADITHAVESLMMAGLNAYLLLFTLGLITLVSEWKMIHCRPVKKILYLFTFPLFLFTYIPIAFVALFKKVEWKPIRHSEVKTLADVRGEPRIAG